MERDVECRLNNAELLREKVFNLVYAVLTPCTWTPCAFVWADLGVDGVIILQRIGKKKDDGVDLPEDRHQQISLLIMATKLRVPSSMEEFWVR